MADSRMQLAATAAII